MTVFRLQSPSRFALVLAAALSVLAPRPATAAAPTGKDAALIAALETELARPFFLPKELNIDPSLRAQAQDIMLAHLVRFSKLLPVWVEEERRAQGPDPAPNRLFDAVFARLLNEFALWHLDTGDADYERATLAVLNGSPQVCKIVSKPNANDFAYRMQRVQAMPAAQRPAALAAERQLLERWGKPRPAPPPWPAPLPRDAALAAIAEIRTGTARPAALPPVLASQVLAQQMDYSELPQETRCALHQWWLRASLAQGSAPAAALAAFRYGTLMTASARFETAADKLTYSGPTGGAIPHPPYPDLARRFGVTGSMTLARKRDPAGKPVEASIVARDFKVPGIRGARPVAFEDAFDAVALQYAMLGGGGSPNAPRQDQFALKWTLEKEDAPAALPRAGESGAGKKKEGKQR